VTQNKILLPLFELLGKKVAIAGEGQASLENMFFIQILA
jgi:hypothetical protein